MYCANCGAAVTGNFCMKCGALAQPQAAAAGAIVPPPIPPTAPYVVPVIPAATLGARVGAYLIEAVPIYILQWAAFMVIVTSRDPRPAVMIVGIISATYWLLRDINGASPGKLALGLLVVKKDGSPSAMGDRILRNVTLAIGPALHIFPIATSVMSARMLGIVTLIEVVMLLAKRERLGDIFAGTMVIKKR